jgi:hypothetical protein
MFNLDNGNSSLCFAVTLATTNDQVFDAGVPTTLNTIGCQGNSNLITLYLKW